MEAKELRIGNIVWYETDQKEIEVNSKTLLYFSEIYYKPIPLTGEELEIKEIVS